MLIERIPAWALYVVYVSFVVLLVAAMVVGRSAPSVWTSLSVSSWACQEPSTQFEASTCFGSDFARGLGSPPRHLSVQLMVRDQDSLGWEALAT